MESVRAVRKSLQMLATEALGLNAYWQRTGAQSVKMLGHDVDIIRLPASTDVEKIQNAAGANYFMLGFSPLGGDDPLA